MLAFELRRAETSCQSRARSVTGSGWPDCELEAGTISNELVDARWHEAVSLGSKFRRDDVKPSVRNQPCPDHLLGLANWLQTSN